MIAAALAVELLMSILQHPKKLAYKMQFEACYFSVLIIGAWHIQRT